MENIFDKKNKKKKDYEASATSIASTSISFEKSLSFKTDLVLIAPNSIVDKLCTIEDVDGGITPSTPKTKSVPFTATMLR